MSIGLMGQKIGMTRVFTEYGVSIPVSVVEVLPNRVTQLKTLETDGYMAIQLVAGVKKASRVNKSEAGHFAKAKVEAGRFLKEFPIDSIENYELGKEISASDIFNSGQLVDVTGVSKGKGFAGTVKRHNFRTQDASHGNSRSHRVPGSIGQNQTPGRVFKGKKMAGHMGNEKCTTLNLELIRVDTDRNLMLIKGAIPGCPGSYVVIRPAIKSRRG